MFRLSAFERVIGEIEMTGRPVKLMNSDLFMVSAFFFILFDPGGCFTIFFPYMSRGIISFGK